MPEFTVHSISEVPASFRHFRLSALSRAALDLQPGQALFCPRPDSCALAQQQGGLWARLRHIKVPTGRRYRTRQDRARDGVWVWWEEKQDA